MATLAERKDALVRWTPVYLWDVTTKDGTVRYWSTRAVSWGGHDYEPAVLDHSSFKVDIGVYGIEAVPEISLVLNNAGGSMTTIVEATNWQGAEIIPRFIFLDPTTGETTEDCKVLGIFLADLPSATWPRIEVNAHNRLNFVRKELPLSKITRKDRYPFPDTDEQREAAYSDPSSEYYANGYSPDHGHGNYKGGGQPFTSADYNGTRDTNHSASESGYSLHDIGLDIRHGGFGKCPPGQTFTMWQWKNKPVVETKGSVNESKYGSPVPLVYGKCRVTAIILETGFPPAWGGARLSHLLLCDGVNFAPSESDMGVPASDSGTQVFLPDQGKYHEIPHTSSDPSVTGAWSLQVGRYGHQTLYLDTDYYRNVDHSDGGADFPRVGGQQPDFPDRDVYSGLAFLSIGYPSELAAQGEENGPTTEVIFKGLQIETWDAGGWPEWKWTDNPVWIFVDLLKRLRVSTSQIDKVAAYEAAAYCDEIVPSGKKRFRCNLLLNASAKAADILRGVRNNCRLYTTIGDDGKIQLQIKKSFADEGGAAFDLGDSNIVRDESGNLQVKKFSKSAYETANAFSVSFQDEDNQYIVDSITQLDLTNINQIDERISGDSITNILGLPSYDQAERILHWLRWENIGLNEYYQVRSTLALIECRVGQVGTITDVRNGLEAQECRIISMAPGPAGTIDLVLQKHSDIAYSDSATDTPLDRARADSSYSPRSVGNLTALETFVQDDTNMDEFRRKIEVAFTPPPTSFNGSMSRRTRIHTPIVSTSGGALTGLQHFFVEVCPRADGEDGRASDPLLVTIPEGVSSGSVSFTCRLPAEATEYVVRAGPFPGRCFEVDTYSSPGADEFTFTITDISSLDETSISPDPTYHHCDFFYWFDGSPNNIRMAGSTKGPADAAFVFQPEAPGAGDLKITVVACSVNASETDFYPFLACPFVEIDLTQDCGNPSGAANLVILQNKDDASIPPGQMVFQWDRDTANYKTIFACEINLSTMLPAQGPYKVEKEAHPTATIETGTCTVTARSLSVTQVTRAAAPTIVGRPIMIFTDDADPDSDLDGNVVGSEGLNAIGLTKAFEKSGTFTYCVLKCWWRCDGVESVNSWEHTYYMNEMAILSVEELVWRTRPVPIPAQGWFYATCIRRNKFGAGTTELTK